MTGNYVAQVKLFTGKLNKVFSLKDLGELHYFLGFEIKRDEAGMYLKKYILDILKKFNMYNASICPTPMVTGRKFTALNVKTTEFFLAWFEP